MQNPGSDAGVFVLTISVPLLLPTATGFVVWPQISLNDISVRVCPLI
jgi:hypothetical protein